MTNQETIDQYKYLSAMVQTTGWKCFIKYLDKEIKDTQDSFLLIPIDPDSDYKRFEKQVRLKILNEIKDWADETISRGVSLEQIDAALSVRNAAILGTNRTR